MEHPYAAYHKWYRVGCVAPEGDARRAHLAEAALNRLAVSGGAPAGAVWMAINRVLCNGVDRLHVSLRTSSDRTVREAIKGVVKVVKWLRRVTHMEDSVCRILKKVRATELVASAMSGSSMTTATSRGQSARGSSAAATLSGAAGADPSVTSPQNAEDHHAPPRRRGGGCAAGHRERGIGKVCDGRTPGPHTRGASSLPVMRGHVDSRHGPSDPVSPKRPLALAREICPTDAYFESFRWRSTCERPVTHQPQPRSRDFPGTSKSRGRPRVKGQILCKPDLDH